MTDLPRPRLPHPCPHCGENHRTFLERDQHLRFHCSELVGRRAANASSFGAVLAHLEAEESVIDFTRARAVRDGHPSIGGDAA